MARSYLNHRRRSGLLGRTLAGGQIAAQIGPQGSFYGSIDRTPSYSGAEFEATSIPLDGGISDPERAHQFSPDAEILDGSVIDSSGIQVRPDLLEASVTEGAGSSVDPSDQDVPSDEILQSEDSFEPVQEPPTHSRGQESQVPWKWVLGAACAGGLLVALMKR